MLGVFLIGAALFAFSTLLGASLRTRLLLLAGLWAFVVLVHLTLPDGAPLRLATGGNARPWIVLAAVAALIWAYRAGLSVLRRRAERRTGPAMPSDAPPPQTQTQTQTQAQAQAQTQSQPQPQTPPFSDAELNRYARHVMLREVGGPGQKALKQARVLVIGAGGLGSPALLYLAAAGVGTIGVIDDDSVDSSNLQRQVIHTDARIDLPKVFSAQQQMQALNPFITVRPYHRRLTEDNATALFLDYDLILDGTDNFDTRYLVNRAAVATGKPLIAAAITQWEGQISLYHPAAGAPCYQCVFPQRPAPGLVPSCAEAGVIAPLPGVLGTMMALEAIKHITGAGETLRNALFIFDGLYGETRRLAVSRRTDCPVCASDT